MNRIEHLLTILGEEGSELAQQTCKANRFGLHEQRDLPTSNADRLQTEYNDILAVAEMLNEEVGTILYRDTKLMRKKREKVEKYLNYSESLGTLTHPS